MQTPGNQKNIDELIDQLTCDDIIACRNARQSLVEIGQEAVPRLIDALSDKREWVRWEAAKALGEIDGPKAAQALLDHLEDERFDIRWLAAEGLIPAGKPIVEPILQALLDRPQSVWLRQSAHRVFRGLARGDLGDLLNPVLRAIESDDPSVRMPVAAEAALGKLHGHSG